MRRPPAPATAGIPLVVYGSCASLANDALYTSLLDPTTNYIQMYLMLQAGNYDVADCGVVWAAWGLTRPARPVCRG